MKKVIFNAVSEEGKKILIGYGWSQSDIKVMLPKSVTLEISDSEEFVHTLEITKRFLNHRIELDITMIGEEEIRIREKVEKEEKDRDEETSKEAKKEEQSFETNEGALPESKPLSREVLKEMVQMAFLSNPEKSYTKVELAKELQVKLSSLSSIFYNLEKRGVIQRIKRGKYQLVFQGNAKESDEKATDSKENPENDGKNQEIGEDTQPEDNLKKEVIMMISKLTGKDTTEAKTKEEAPEEGSKEAASQEETPEEGAKEVASQKETPEEEPKEAASQEETPEEEPKEAASQEEIPEKESKEAASQEEVPEEEPKEVASQEEAPEKESKEAASQEEAPEEEPKEVASQEETSKEEEIASKKETQKIGGSKPKEEMVKNFLEDYQELVDYILTRKSFMVKSIKRKFSEQDVVDVIRAFDDEVIHYHPSQEGVYLVSQKWRVWYYLLKKNSAEEEGTIQYDLQLTQKETTKAITQAMQENLIRDVTGKKDRFEKYSI